MSVHLILGGARSGKSRYAETIALSFCDAPVYIATAPIIKGDSEWLARIEHHRNNRSDCWQLIEEELALTSALKKAGGAGQVVLVDCLTLWLSNLMFAAKDVDAEITALCECLPVLVGNVILVSNEVGMGLVPESSEGRAFRDAQGRLNQAVAAVADRVEFTAAGLSICLKE